MGRSLMQSRENEEGENQTDDAFTDTNGLNSKAAFWRVFQNRVKKPKSYIIKILDRRRRRS